MSKKNRQGQNSNLGQSQTETQNTETNTEGRLIIDRKFEGRFAALLQNTEEKYRPTLLDTVFHAGLKAIERRRKKAGTKSVDAAVAKLAALGYKIEKVA